MTGITSRRPRCARLSTSLRGGWCSSATEWPRSECRTGITLGELAGNVADRRATLRDGTLAGGATDLLRCVQNAVRFGIPLWEAVAAATMNPAKAIGRFEKIGSLEVGKAADLVLLRPDLTLSRVYLAGERVV